MVASITFRLKSSNHVGTIDMEGSVMSYSAAQQAIAAKLCAPPEEIDVFLAGSTSLMHPDDDLPAYAVVDVVRRTQSSRPALPTRPKPTLLSTSTDAPGSSGLAGGYGGGLGADMNADGQPLTEEERLAQLQAEAALDTGIDGVSMRHFRGGRGRGMGIGRGGGGFGGPPGEEGGGDYYFGGRGRGEAFRANMIENFRPPPKGYICHNCGKGGHLIQHCPSAKGGKALKMLSFPVGIPESMLEECTMDDPAPKFITRDHRLVKRRVDPSAFTAISIAGVTDHRKDDDDADVVGGRGDAVTAQPLASGVAHEALADEKDHNAVSDDVNGATTTSSSPSPAPAPIDSKYLCVVDHLLAREAMKLPCCGRLLCQTCFTKMAEEAFDETRSLDDDDGGVVCPSCGEPLLMDDVVPAPEERVQIKTLLAARKREREA
ncbi:Zinc knuckle [Lotmaria passim]